MGNYLGAVPNLGCSLTGREKKRETQAAHQLPVDGLPMLSKDSWPIRIIGLCVWTPLSESSMDQCSGVLERSVGLSV